jgi:hypothetical protein
MTMYERFHSGVNAVCKRCKNIFTHHPADLEPDKEYQCEGCNVLEEKGLLNADGTAPAPEPIAVPDAPNTLQTPEPVVEADPANDNPSTKAGAVFPDGDKDKMITHATVDETLEHPAEAQGKPADAPIDTNESDEKSTKKK